MSRGLSFLCDLPSKYQPLNSHVLVYQYPSAVTSMSENCFPLVLIGNETVKQVWGYSY